MIRIGVLASGGGTNLQAILDGCAAGRIDGEVALVLSNVAGAGALGRAAAAGAPHLCVPSRGTTDRAAYDRALAERLAAARVDLVCLAGYMRIVGPGFLRAFGPTATTRGCPRVLNVHPALLPAFPGLHAPRQALAAGAKISGCTVHFVTEEVDCGPIVVQRAVEVREDDTVESLKARILAEEHRALPEAVRLIASGRARIEGRRVVISPGS